MKHLEELMAKSLAGTFVWEGTTKHEPPECELVSEIRAAQRRHIDKMKPLKRSSQEIVQSRADAKLYRDLNLPETVVKVRQILARHYKVDEANVVGGYASHHYDFVRGHFTRIIRDLYPNESRNKLGKMIGKHYNTFMRALRSFEKGKNEHKADIDAVNAALKEAGVTQGLE